VPVGGSHRKIRKHAADATRGGDEAARPGVSDTGDLAGVQNVLRRWAADFYEERERLEGKSRTESQRFGAEEGKKGDNGIVREMWTKPTEFLEASERGYFMENESCPKERGEVSIQKKALREKSRSWREEGEDLAGLRIRWRAIYLERKKRVENKKDSVERGMGTIGVHGKDTQEKGNMT